MRTSRLYLYVMSDDTIYYNIQAKMINRASLQGNSRANAARFVLGVTSSMGSVQILYLWFTSPS